MITFKDLGLYGRLGNQMFQYASLRGIAEKNGFVCKIPDFSSFNWHGQNCLLNNFNIEADKLQPIDQFNILGRNINEKNHDQFDESFFNLPENVSIKGFFQFTKYFEHCEDLIKKEFTPKEQYLNPAQKIIDSYRKDGYEIVSIHVRRGDMMQHMYADTGVHPDSVFGVDNIFDNNTIFGNYLNKSMDFFSDRKVKYFVFAGGKRTGDDADDISYIKRVFKGDEFIISDSNDPMVDFTRIMSCDHNITCHQSTFGWWAAYLNSNKNKIVTSPEHYFFLYSKERSDQRISNGHFPKDWNIVK
jgi:hypothetical protein